MNLEDCSGCGLSGWGWQDNGWGVGVLGPLVYFSTTGAQKLRIQSREDGISIDQIVLSPSTYLSSAPGGVKNDATILQKSDGSTPAPGPDADAAEVVLWAANAPVRVGPWNPVSDSTAADGARLQNPNAGAAKLTTAVANPTNYFEMTFNAEADTPYRLWIRAKAESNSWANDSIFVQFSRSVTSSGNATWRIGTTSATEMNLEDCSGCGLSGWGWQDNGWGVGTLGPLVYFSAAGEQKLRIQYREDGIAIDQIVLSPAEYLSSAPGAVKNDATILPESGG
jgi:hypothetical protein